MNPPPDNWTPGVHNQQGSDPSLYITSLLGQLYAMLQGFYPEWCQANPFTALVQGKTYHQLCELHLTWTEWIEYYQAQVRPPVPVVYVPLSNISIASQNSS